MIEMENNLVSEMGQLVSSDGKYSRESFERFGDDLCELLLSFLPLRQKFRFECISKQWKSLIFNKEFVLEIDELKNDIKFLDSNIVNDIKFYSFNEKNLETVVKKCVFIKHLMVKWLDCYFKDNGCIFELMANYCRYLEKFEFCFWVYKFNDIYFYDKLSEFGDKCGPKLKFLNINCGNLFYKSLLKKTPNVRKVCFNYIAAFIESNNENFLPKLIEVEFLVYDFIMSFDNEFQLFVDKYHEKLKSIDITLYKYVDNIFIELSRFEKLEVLKFSHDSTCDYDIESFIFINEGLNIIANNCKQLNDLSFRMEIEVQMEVKIFKEDFLKSISQIKSLNSLSIEWWSENLGELKHLSNIKNLLKLSLIWLILSDEDFKDVEKYLPNLTSLRLYHGFYSKITNKTLEYLSKLPNLSSFKFRCYQTIYGTVDRITMDGILKLINNTSNLRFIEIISDIDLFQDEVIESLIELANQRHEVMIKFFLDVPNPDSGSSECRKGYSGKKEKIEKNILELKSKDLPKNLIVNVTCCVGLD